MAAFQTHTFSDDHADGFGRDGNVVVDLFIASSEHGLSSTHIAIAGALSIHVLGITLDDFVNELPSHGCGLRSSDEVDRAETIDALLFPNDVDMASASLLKIAYGLSPSTDDEPHGPIGDQDLCCVFPCSQSWSMGPNALDTDGIEVGLPKLFAIICNDPRNLSFGVFSCSLRARYLALADRSTGFGTRQELHPRGCLILHPPQILSLAANDETD